MAIFTFTPGIKGCLLSSLDLAEKETVQKEYVAFLIA